MRSRADRPVAFLFVAVLGTLSAAVSGAPAAATNWSSDPVWLDGLVEKAVYTGSRVIYGRPRPFEAVFLTNKEDHDRRTLTKAERSTDVVNVWKHNQVEVIPTPNYDYKFEATTHMTSDGKHLLTRLDVASQEWCGTSFKQLQLAGPTDRPRWDYFGFSYMPESGRETGTIDGGAGRLVPFNSLPLYLRDYDFAAKAPVAFRMLPDQKSNRATPWKPLDATVRFVGETTDAYELELLVDAKPTGRFAFAKDRLHVMLRYESSDGTLKYTLKELGRVNYWTISGE